MTFLTKRLPPLLGALLITIPFYRPLLFSDRALFFRDLTRDFLPNKMLWAHSVAGGSGIPYWNHLIHGGTPFYAVNTTSPLHPLNFLFLTMNPAKALVYFIWVHYIFLYLGFYLLARRLRLPPWPATLLGAALPLSGVMLSTHSLPHYLASSVAVPFWLLGLLRLRKGRIVPWLTGAAIGWPIIAGDPQFTYLMALITPIFLMRNRKQRPMVAIVGDFAQIGISAVLFSAAQLLPTAGFLLASSRIGMTMEEVLGFSLHPLRLLEAVVPFAFGNRFGTNSVYWGQGLVNFIYRNPFIFSLYPGYLLLVLAGTFRRRDKSQAQFLVGCAGVLLLAFGAYLQPSLYALTAQALPGFRLFRYPERLAFWGLLLTWLAAARSMATLLTPEQEQEGTPRTSLARELFFPASLLLLSLGALAAFRIGISEVEPHWHPGALSTAGFSLAWLLVLLRLRKNVPHHWRRRALLGAALATLIFDAGLNGQRLVWDQSVHTPDIRRYPLAQAIEKDLLAQGAGPQARRLNSLFNTRHPFWSGSLDFNTASTNFSLSALLPNTAMLFGIEDAFGYLSLQDSTREEFLSNILFRNSGKLDYRFLNDLMAVRYVPEISSDGSVKLTINQSAQPYVFVPPRVQFAASAKAAFTLMRSEAFRSHEDLVLLSDHPAPALPQSGPSPHIEIQERNGREIRLRLAGPRLSAQYLLLNESHSKNWRAYLEDAPLRIEKGNQWAMAVLLPPAPGEAQTLSFRYEDPLIPMGQALSGLWILGCAGLWLAPRPRRRPRPAG